MDRCKNLKLYLFDLDGTLYLGEQVFPFTAALLEKIRAAGGNYMFMTNNSSKSVQAYVQKLRRMMIPSTPDDFITSAQATVYYLKRHAPNARLYVCGTRSFTQELESSGFCVTGDPAQTDCIVMGFDTELTYQKLWDVCRMLCTRDVMYIATNPDYVCPTEFGSVPDCGSICDMVFNATGKRPVVIGKPEKLMAELAMAKWGCTGAQTAVVGDRLYTDIRCGRNAGAVTILVMSGETTRQMLESSEYQPDIVLDDAGQILSWLPA